jgi:hypothetical protein
VKQIQEKITFEEQKVEDEADELKNVYFSLFCRNMTMKKNKMSIRNMQKIKKKRLKVTRN